MDFKDENEPKAGALANGDETTVMHPGGSNHQKSSQSKKSHKAKGGVFSKRNAKKKPKTMSNEAFVRDYLKSHSNASYDNVADAYRVEMNKKPSHWLRKAYDKVTKGTAIINRGSRKIKSRGKVNIAGRSVLTAYSAASFSDKSKRISLNDFRRWVHDMLAEDNSRTSGDLRKLFKGRYNRNPNKKIFQIWNEEYAMLNNRSNDRLEDLSSDENRRLPTPPPKSPRKKRKKAKKKPTHPIRNSSRIASDALTRLLEEEERKKALGLSPSEDSKEDSESEDFSYLNREADEDWGAPKRMGKKTIATVKKKKVKENKKVHGLLRKKRASRDKGAPLPANTGRVFSKKMAEAQARRNTGRVKKKALIKNRFVADELKSDYSEDSDEEIIWKAPRVQPKKKKAKKKKKKKTPKKKQVKHIPLPPPLPPMKPVVKQTPKVELPRQRPQPRQPAPIIGKKPEKKTAASSASSDSDVSSYMGGPPIGQEEMKNSDDDILADMGKPDARVDQVVSNLNQFVNARQKLVESSPSVATASDYFPSPPKAVQRPVWKPPTPPTVAVGLFDTWVKPGDQVSDSWDDVPSPLAATPKISGTVTVDLPPGSPPMIVSAPQRIQTPTPPRKHKIKPGKREIDDETTDEEEEEKVKPRTNLHRAGLPSALPLPSTALQRAQNVVDEHFADYDSLPSTAGSGAENKIDELAEMKEEIEQQSASDVDGDLVDALPEINEDDLEAQLEAELNDAADEDDIKDEDLTAEDIAYMEYIKRKDAMVDMIYKGQEKQESRFRLAKEGSMKKVQGRVAAPGPAGKNEITIKLGQERYDKRQEAKARRDAKIASGEIVPKPKKPAKKRKSKKGSMPSGVIDENKEVEIDSDDLIETGALTRLLHEDADYPQFELEEALNDNEANKDQIFGESDASKKMLAAMKTSDLLKLQAKRKARKSSGGKGRGGPRGPRGPKGINEDLLIRNELKRRERWKQQREELMAQLRAGTAERTRYLGQRYRKSAEQLREERTLLNEADDYKMNFEGYKPRVRTHTGQVVYRKRLPRETRDHGISKQDWIDARINSRNPKITKANPKPQNHNTNPTYGNLELFPEEKSYAKYWGDQLEEDRKKFNEGKGDAFRRKQEAKEYKLRMAKESKERYEKMKDMDDEERAAFMRGYAVEDRFVNEDMVPVNQVIHPQGKVAVTSTGRKVSSALLKRNEKKRITQEMMRRDTERRVRETAAAVAKTKREWEEKKNKAAKAVRGRVRIMKKTDAEMTSEAIKKQQEDAHAEQVARWEAEAAERERREKNKLANRERFNQYQASVDAQNRARVEAMYPNVNQTEIVIPPLPTAEEWEEQKRLQADPAVAVVGPIELEFDSDVTPLFSDIEEDEAKGVQVEEESSDWDPIPVGPPPDDALPSPPKASPVKMQLPEPPRAETPPPPVAPRTPTYRPVSPKSDMEFEEYDPVPTPERKSGTYGTIEEIEPLFLSTITEEQRRAERGVASPKNRRASPPRQPLANIEGPKVTTGDFDISGMTDDKGQTFKQWAKKYDPLGMFPLAGTKMNFIKRFGTAEQKAAIQAVLDAEAEAVANDDYEEESSDDSTQYDVSTDGDGGDESDRGSVQYDPEKYVKDEPVTTRRASPPKFVKRIETPPMTPIKARGPEDPPETPEAKSVSPIGAPIDPFQVPYDTDSDISVGSQEKDVYYGLLDSGLIVPDPEREALKFDRPEIPMMEIHGRTHSDDLRQERFQKRQTFQKKRVHWRKKQQLAQNREDIEMVLQSADDPRAIKESARRLADLHQFEKDRERRRKIEEAKRVAEVDANNINPFEREAQKEVEELPSDQTTDEEKIEAKQETESLDLEMSDISSYKADSPKPAAESPSEDSNVSSYMGEDVDNDSDDDIIADMGKPDARVDATKKNMQRFLNPVQAAMEQAQLRRQMNIRPDTIPEEPESDEEEQAYEPTPSPVKEKTPPPIIPGRVSIGSERVFRSPPPQMKELTDSESEFDSEDEIIDPRPNPEPKNELILPDVEKVTDADDKDLDLVQAKGRAIILPTNRDQARRALHMLESGNIPKFEVRRTVRQSKWKSKLVADQRGIKRYLEYVHENYPDVPYSQITKSFKASYNFNRLPNFFKRLYRQVFKQQMGAGFGDYDACRYCDGEVDYNKQRRVLMCKECGEVQGGLMGGMFSNRNNNPTGVVGFSDESDEEDSRDDLQGLNEALREEMRRGIMMNAMPEDDEKAIMVPPGTLDLDGAARERRRLGRQQMLRDDAEQRRRDRISKRLRQRAQMGLARGEKVDWVEYDLYQEELEERRENTQYPLMPGYVVADDEFDSVYRPLRGDLNRYQNNGDVIDSVLNMRTNRFSRSAVAAHRQREDIKSFVLKVLNDAYPERTYGVPEGSTLREVLPAVDLAIGQPGVSPIDARRWRRLRNMIVKKSYFWMDARVEMRYRRKDGTWNPRTRIQTYPANVQVEAGREQEMLDDPSKFLMEDEALKHIAESYPDQEIVRIISVRKIRQANLGTSILDLTMNTQLHLDERGRLNADGMIHNVIKPIPARKLGSVAGDCVSVYLAERLNYYEDHMRPTKSKGIRKKLKHSPLSVATEFIHLFGMDSKEPGFTARQIIEWAKIKKFITVHVYIQGCVCPVETYYARSTKREVLVRAQKVLVIRFMVANNHLTPIYGDMPRPSIKLRLRKPATKMLMSADVELVEGADQLQEWVEGTRCTDKTAITEIEDLMEVLGMLFQTHDVIPYQFQTNQAKGVSAVVHPLTGELLISNCDYAAVQVIKNNESGEIMQATREKPHIPPLHKPNCGLLSACLTLFDVRVGSLPDIAVDGRAAALTDEYTPIPMRQIKAQRNKVEIEEDCVQIDINNCYPRCLATNRNRIPIFSDMDNLYDYHGEPIDTDVQYFVKGIWFYGFWFQPRTVMGGNLKELIKIHPRIGERVFAYRKARRSLPANFFAEFINYVMDTYPQSCKPMLNKFIGFSNKTKTDMSYSFVSQSREELDAIFNQFREVFEGNRAHCEFLMDKNLETIAEEATGLEDSILGGLCTISPAFAELDIEGVTLHHLSIKVSKPVVTNNAYIYSTVMDNYVTKLMCNMFEFAERGWETLAINTDSFTIRTHGNDFFIPQGFKREEVHLPYRKCAYIRTGYACQVPDWTQIEEKEIDFTQSMFYDGGAGSGKTTTTFLELARQVRAGTYKSKKVLVTAHQNVTTQQNKKKMLKACEDIGVRMRLGARGDNEELDDADVCLFPDLDEKRQDGMEVFNMDDCVEVRFDTVCAYVEGHECIYDLVICDEVSMLNEYQYVKMYQRMVKGDYRTKHIMAGDYGQLPPVQNTQYDPLYYAPDCELFKDLCDFRRRYQQYEVGKNRFDLRTQRAIEYLRKFKKLPQWALQHIQPLDPTLTVNITYTNRVRQEIIKRHGKTNLELIVGDTVQIINDKTRVVVNDQLKEKYKDVIRAEGGLCLKSLGLYVGLQYVVAANDVNREKMKLRSTLSDEVIDFWVPYKMVTSDVAFTSHKSQGQTISEPANIYEFGLMHWEQQYTVLTRFAKLEYIHCDNIRAPYTHELDWENKCEIRIGKALTVGMRHSVADDKREWNEQKQEWQQVKKVIGNWLVEHDENKVEFYAKAACIRDLNLIEKWKLNEDTNLVEAVPRAHTDRNAALFNEVQVGAREIQNELDLCTVDPVANTMNYESSYIDVDENTGQRRVRRKRISVSTTVGMNAAENRMRDKVSTYLKTQLRINDDFKARGSTFTKAYKDKIRYQYSDKIDPNAYHDIIEERYDPENRSHNQTFLSSRWVNSRRGDGIRRTVTEKDAVQVVYDTYYRQAKPLSEEAKSSIYSDLRTYKAIYTDPAKNKNQHGYFSASMRDMAKTICALNRFQTKDERLHMVSSGWAIPEATFQEICTINTRMCFDLDLPAGDGIEEEEVLPQFFDALHKFMVSKGGSGLKLEDVRIMKSNNQQRKISYHIVVRNHVFPSIAHQHKFTSRFIEYILDHKEEYLDLLVDDFTTGVDNICTKNRAMRLPWCCKPGKNNHLIPMEFDQDGELVELENEYNPLVDTEEGEDTISALLDYFVCTSFNDIESYSEFSECTIALNKGRKSMGANNQGRVIVRSKLKPAEKKQLKQLLNANSERLQGFEWSNASVVYNPNGEFVKFNLFRVHPGNCICCNRMHDRKNALIYMRNNQWFFQCYEVNSSARQLTIM